MARHLQIHKSMILLSKITHEMWCNHAFHQRKKATKRAGGWKVGGGWRKFEKGGVGNVGRPSGNRGV